MKNAFKKIKKGLLPCIMCLAVVAGAFGIGAVLQSNASAEYATTYDKSHTTEYYYASGTQFIEYIGVYWSSGSTSKAVSDVAGKKDSSGNPYCQSIGFDLNDGAGGDDLQYYATRTISKGAPIIALAVDESSTKTGYETVCYYTGGSLTTQAADANSGAGGKYIYTHFQRYSNIVNTDLLREAVGLSMMCYKKVN